MATTICKHANAMSKKSSVFKKIAHIRISKFSTTAEKRKGLVLGVYETEKDSPLDFTRTAKGYNEKTQSKVQQLLDVVKKPLKAGKTRILHGTDPEFSSIIITCIGKKGTGFNEQEMYDEGKEQVRTAVASAVLQLRDIGETEIVVDPCGDAEAAAEGTHLSLFSYDELKAEDKKKPAVGVTCATEYVSDRHHVESDWSRGTSLANGQNLSRRLMEMPANILTPTKFAEIVSDKLSTSTCKVTVRDKKWAESQKMGAYLSVAQGSVEPPVFLEIDYAVNAANENPYALVGKGITFDTGGISIKPSSGMDAMRADMGGAACVVGALHTLNKLKLPVYIKAFIPLCENMPSGTAMRPGDVVTAMNGKTIQVDNTDAEGRLILADALCYSESFKPKMILDMATLTGAMDVALGAGTAGTFTNSTAMWQLIQDAGSKTGDRLWRMPLFNHYTKKITKCQLADLNNIGGSRSAGACTAAAFLKEFVTNKNWLHLDIAGVMMNNGDVPYLGKGMSGRPTRTIVEFLNLLSKQDS